MKDKIARLQLDNNRLEKERNMLIGWISLISHDTKQLFGNLKWIIDAYDEEIISQVEFLDMLPQIKKDATKSFNTAKDTGDWLKTQYGNFVARNDTLKAFELFEQIRDDNKSKIEEKKIQFEYCGDQEILIKTDKILLLFILQKITDNAIKYSHRDSIVRFNVSETSTDYLISISDCGIGISENNLQNIFSFDNSVFEGTDGEIGAGLSLKIVQSFVFLARGTMQINSLELEGTTVSVSLPRIIDK